jgi:hypothetical protein
VSPADPIGNRLENVDLKLQLIGFDALQQLRRHLVHGLD